MLELLLLTPELVTMDMAEQLSVEEQILLLMVTIRNQHSIS